MVALASPASSRASSDRAIGIWLLACCAMIFLMVLIGGITRLTESGLSITQWKPVEGVLPPLNDAQWQDAFAQYKAIPQYEAIHADMTLDQFKHIYFWEYIHRLWGRLIGFAFLLPFLWFLIRGQVSRRLIAPLAGLFVLGGLQGALGWWMVESGLEARIEVSQYRLAAHLAMAVVIYLAMLWVALGLVWPSSSSALAHNSSPPRKRGTSDAALDSRFRGNDGVTRNRGLAAAAWLVVLMVFTTLVAGAFVAGTRAGYLDNTFPLMEGQFVPPDYWHLTPLWRNWFENLTTVQFDHRVLAETTWFVIAALWFASLRASLTQGQRWAVHGLFFFACLQLALGITTLLTVVWLPVAAAHQAGALCLLSSALIAAYAFKS
jgi:cytochrome c oxidase assembly protein subunit 15